jgi:hypothetical protein
MLKMKAKDCRKKAKNGNCWAKQVETLAAEYSNKVALQTFKYQKKKQQT